MERSSKFISLSGLSGVMAGVYALIGSFLAYRIVYKDMAELGVKNPYVNDTQVWGQLIVIALTVLVLSLATGLILTLRQSRKKEERFWNPGSILLAFSEQIGFNKAYLIASVSTVSLVSIFIAALLRNKKPAIVFASILTVFYSFIYVIIQLQDLALLFGDVGLFITVAVLMYLSTRIDWSKR